MYIDYTYFSENGGSADVTGPAFPAVEYRARAVVDRYTQQRVQAMTAVPEAVKRLMVELVNAEAHGGANAILNPAVSSFSADGYSETYAVPMTAETVAAGEAALVKTYLSGVRDDKGTPLLWLGVT